MKKITSNLSSGKTALVARSYTDIACLAKPCSSSNFAYNKYNAENINLYIKLIILKG